MTEEQRKVRQFFKDFQGWKADNIGTWIGAGMLVLLMLVVCAIPVQEILFDIEEIESVTWLMLLLFGPMAGLLYLRPYTTFTEMASTNSAKNVKIVDKLIYLPIDFKEIRKMKVIYLLRFFAIILPFAAVLQCLTSVASYGEVTWMNLVYVLFVAFVWPVVVNLPGILLETK